LQTTPAEGSSVGITATYRRVSTADLKRLEADRRYAARYFGTSIESALQAFMQLQPSDEAPSLDASAADESVLDIDKDWQAIHFLLTGEFCFAGESKTPPPLGNVIMGGTETKWEATYGRIRLLSPQEVRDVAEGLQGIAREGLVDRLDAEEFNRHKVYPARDRWDAEELEGLLDVYDRIKAFFLLAAANRQAVLISFD
jgi:hypothetical protein